MTQTWRTLKSSVFITVCTWILYCTFNNHFLSISFFFVLYINLVSCALFSFCSTILICAYSYEIAAFIFSRAVSKSTGSTHRLHNKCQAPMIYMANEIDYGRSVTEHCNGGICYCFVFPSVLSVFSWAESSRMWGKIASPPLLKNETVTSLESLWIGLEDSLKRYTIKLR